MRKVKRSLLSDANETVQSRAAALVRPTVEAALLAAVAIGFAQAGWNFVQISRAGGAGAGGLEPTGSLGRAGPLQTPFEPAAAFGGPDQAELALAGLEVQGVRAGVGSLAGGAILKLADGRQQAFLVGHEVSPGVLFTAVTREGISVSVGGVERTLALAGAPGRSTGPSYADQLMGREGPGQSAVVQVAAADVAAPAQITALSARPLGGQDGQAPLAAALPAAPALAALDAADKAWLQQTFAAKVATHNGQAGFLLGAPLPRAVAEAGFKPGDVVVRINGEPLDNPLTALSAVKSGRPLSLGVMGADGQIRTISIAVGETP